MTDMAPFPEGIDVELKRDISLRGVVGSVGRHDRGPVAVAILDSEWRAADQGMTVPDGSPIAQLAAHLAVNEPGGEPPGEGLIEVKGLAHYPVRAEYIIEAAKQLR
jgi:hypothetical protein